MGTHPQCYGRLAGGNQVRLTDDPGFDLAHHVHAVSVPATTRCPARASDRTAATA